MKKPKIIIPLDEAEQKIKTQLRRGKTISKFTIKDKNDLNTVEDRRSGWYEYTKNLLEEIDENSSLVKDFHYLTPTALSGTRGIQDRVNDFRNNMEKDVSNLESILNHIKILKEVKKKPTTKKDKKRSLTAAEKTWMWEHKSHTCYICHDEVEKFSEAHFDHTKAHAKQGRTRPANSGITHVLCNQIKGKKSLKEIQKHLGTYSPKKKNNSKS